MPSKTWKVTSTGATPLVGAELGGLALEDLDVHDAGAERAALDKDLVGARGDVLQEEFAGLVGGGLADALGAVAELQAHEDAGAEQARAAAARVADLAGDRAPAAGSRRAGSHHSLRTRRTSATSRAARTDRYACRQCVR